MGNVQEVERSESYETPIGNLDNGSHDTSDEGNQPDVSSLARDSYSMNLVSQTAEEQVLRGPVAEDIEVKLITTSPWKVPININLDISAEAVLQQKPPEVQWAAPKISPSISISLPSLYEELIQKPLTFEIPVAELSDKSIEDNTDGGKVAGKIMKEAAAVLPPELGFSSGRFQNESPLYPIGMVSAGTQLTELPIIKADRNHLTYLEQPDDQGTTGVNATENQILKPTGSSASSQGESLANSSYEVLEALPNVTQPPNKVLIPISANQNTEQTAKAHPLFAPTSSALESTRGHLGTEVLLNTGGSQDGKAEEMTQETADTQCMTKTIPLKDGSVSIPQPLPCKVKINTQEETQVMCFSYADALKRSFKVTQQRGAPKPHGKDEQGLITLRKLDGHRNTTVEKKATTKALSLRNIKQNSAQVNSKNPRTSWYPTGPSTPPFKTTKEQSRFQWPSPRNNSKDHFQFKGSWNTTQPRVSTPNNSIQFGNRNAVKDKVQHTGNSGSTWTVVKNTSNRKLQEQGKFGDGKKEKVYQSYPIERRNKPKLASNMAPTFTLKEPINRKDSVSGQPQNVGLQTSESTLSKKKLSSTKALAATLEPLFHVVKKDQISKCEPPKVHPYIPQPVPQSEIKEDTEVSTEEHVDTSDLSNSSQSAPHIKETECPDFKDQTPEQSLVVLENETSSEPTTTLEVVDKMVGVEKEDPVPNVAPKHQPSGRWKDFYVDNICTMKCRCRHRPGKLPPNVVRWFSVSQNMLAEPVWVTTLKVASSLVTGTKLLLDHHSSQELDISSSAPNKRPE